MDSQQFVYWLQGFMELQDPTELDSTQVEIIKDHLNLVLGKVTPDRRVFHVDVGGIDTEAQDFIKEWTRPLWGESVCSATTDPRTISLC